MPDLNKLEEHVNLLSRLLEEKDECAGLMSWTEMVSKQWESISNMWQPPPVFEISDEHEKALMAINDSHYANSNLGATVEEMIEEHLTRENGLLGKIRDGVYEL